MSSILYTNVLTRKPKTSRHDKQQRTTGLERQVMISRIGYACFWALFLLHFTSVPLHSLRSIHKKSGFNFVANSKPSLWYLYRWSARLSMCLSFNSRPIFFFVSTVCSYLTGYNNLTVYLTSWHSNRASTVKFSWIPGTHFM